MVRKMVEKKVSVVSEDQSIRKYLLVSGKERNYHVVMP